MSFIRGNQRLYESERENSNIKFYLNIRKKATEQAIYYRNKGIYLYFMGFSKSTEVTSTTTRPVENVVITTKGLEDRKKPTVRWKDGGK